MGGNQAAEQSTVARLVAVHANPALASWLVAQRLPIEQRMRTAMGPAAPRASGGEAETLRRFRSFTGVALHRGQPTPPALDGLQINERRMAALLDAWLGATLALAGPDAAEVERALAPLVAEFRQALRQSGSSRTAMGRPRTARRAVAAAIDRIADGFVAIDTVEGSITDANPAAGALLGTARDALLGVEFAAFVPEDARGVWQARLDAMAEGCDHDRFESALRDASGDRIAVSVSLTAYPTKGRTLALALCRPIAEDAPRARSASAAGLPGAAPSAAAAHFAPDPNAPLAVPAPVGAAGFARLADGKPIARRSASQVRRAPRDVVRRSPAAAPTHPRPPAPDTPPAGSRS